MRACTYCFSSFVFVMLLTVSTPTKPQQQYQNEIVSFNIETFKSHNAGCNAENWNDQDQSPMSDPATFAPQLLNISNWVESFQMVGASSAVLTAKHVCGFMLWPTETVFDDGTPYNYHSPRDVVREFSDTLRKSAICVGLYYSLAANFF